MRVLVALVALLLTLCLAACHFSLSEVASATVDMHGGRRTSETRELTSIQVRALGKWFDERKSGWSSSSASYVPGLIVRAKHRNGQESAINFLPGMVVVNSEGNQIVRKLDQSELAEIKRILEVQSG